MMRSRCTALHGFRYGKPKTFFRLAKPRSSSTEPIFAKAMRNSFSLKSAQSSDSASLPEAPSPPKGGRRCRSAVACAKVRQSGCRTGVATVANSDKLLFLNHSENFKLLQLLSQKIFLKNTYDSCDSWVCDTVVFYGFFRKITHCVRTMKFHLNL